MTALDIRNVARGYRRSDRLQGPNPRQIGPRPAAGRRVGEGVLPGELLRQEPLADPLALRRGERRSLRRLSRQGVDREHLAMEVGQELEQGRREERLAVAGEMP